MEASLKKILKSVTLELRHLLEGRYDTAGVWQPGDLENRLASIGVRGDREPRPADELRLSTEDQHARKVVDAYLKLREEASVQRADAVAEFLRETAYTWANRLIALRCMESRELIDPVILQQEAYGGRSLEHHRLAQRQPEVCAGEDDGLFAVLDKVFREQAERLPMLFDPQSPGIVVRPSPAAIKDCFGLLSLNSETLRKYRIQIQEDEDVDSELPNPFVVPDALGWTYQYWNTEEKERIFEKVRTLKGAKVAGADIIPATQLYTEDYMVEFLVQNSLGAMWMGLHPESHLCDRWDYYVRGADRAPVPATKPVCDITFLDPACGSGHFLLEAFDLFYEMYVEEGKLSDPSEICSAILTRNLFGIDIDPRAVQIAEAALWMKAAERAFDYSGSATNLVAATASHLKGPAWEEFLSGFEREPSVARVLRKFSQTMEHIDEVGSLARPDEDLLAIVREEHSIWERQIRAKNEANFLFPEMNEDLLSGQLPFHEISDEEFGDRLFYRARAGIDTYTQRARDAGDFEDQMLGSETRTGFRLVDLLSAQYDVIVANPPYLGKDKTSSALATCLDRYQGGADVYGAFFEQGLRLLRPCGRLGILSLATYMHLKDFSSFRTHLLREWTLTNVVHLSNKTFEALSNPNAFYFAMTLVAKHAPQENHCVTVIDLDGTECNNKQNILLGCATRPNDYLQRFYSLNQALLLLIPNAPIAFRLPIWAQAAFDNNPLIKDVAAARQGLITGENDRFLRYRWEIKLGERWYRYAKGGEFRRWFGNDEWAVDWERDGARIRNFRTPQGKLRSRPQNVQFFFRAGCTWSSQTISAFGARALEPGSIFDVTGSSVFPTSEDVSPETLLGLINTPAFGALFSAIQPGVHYGEGYLADLPFVRPSNEILVSNIVRQCISIQSALLEEDPTSEQYLFAEIQREGNSCSLEVLAERIIRKRLMMSCELHERECQLWDQVEQDIGVPVAERTVIRRMSYETKVITPVNVAESIAESRIKPTADSWRATQTPVEELCADAGIRPAVLMTLIASCELANQQAMASEFEIAIANILSFKILQSIGHRWPREIENGAAATNGGCTDGIIPLTSIASVPTLFDRVQQQFNDDKIETSAIADRMGKSLQSWLETEYFKYHAKQFKKRPISWQLQSGSFSARRAPAFACLVYYHKLDADTLPKIRSQYVGPLRQRMETELRGIESVATEARSDRQEKRRLELTDAIKELAEFDGKLEQVIRTGFSTKDLAKLLTDEPLDRWCSLDGTRPRPTTIEEFVTQESSYTPDINDGVRVNIAPLQKAGLLAADVLAKKDVDKAIADRAQWRSDERRWVREGKLPQPGWWPMKEDV